MEPIIELEKINYKYQPDDLRPALKDVSFTIDKVSGSLLLDTMVQENRHLPKRSMDCFCQNQGS